MNTREGSNPSNILRLGEPFDPWEVEWRVRQSGKSSGRTWAKVLAYIANRAIMNRLDEYVGPWNWKNEFLPGPLGGVMCGISILCDGEWITKWDVAANTEVASEGQPDNDTNIKGGFSASMKRAAVQWGMGRYLYYLEEGFADCSDTKMEGMNWAKHKTGDVYYWSPPALPPWALPGGSGKPVVIQKSVMRDVPQRHDVEPVAEDKARDLSTIPERISPEEIPNAGIPPRGEHPVETKAPTKTTAGALKDVTLEDMDKALALAEKVGCNKAKFRQAFILYLGSATPKGQIDYKNMTRKQYNVVTAAFLSEEGLNKFLNAPPKKE